MGRAGATTNSRLSVDDWIQAGFASLAGEGIKALKIDRLCRRLEVTKVSFYWHFTDIAGYRAVLVQAWGELRDDDRRHFGELAGLPPRQRLSEMMSSLASARHWTLERAMREWALTDDAAAASVRAADHRVLAAVRQAFLDYGFGAEETDMRANATFAAGIGFLHLAGPQPSERATAGRVASSRSCSSPDALSASHSIPKSMVRGHACPPYRPSARNSWRDWPSALWTPSGCACFRLRRSTTSSPRASPNCSCPRATAACRPISGHPRPRPPDGRTGARPALGRSVSARCTTGCWRCSTSARRRRRSRRGRSSLLLPWRLRAGASRRARAFG